jgi:hypothetical protein
MTKTVFIVSLLAFAAAGQASAGGMPASGPQNFPSNDPCLIGTAADQADCAGMIRVAPGMTVHSQTYSTTSNQGSSSQSSSPTPLFDPNRGYSHSAVPAQPVQTHAMAPSTQRQQTITVTSTYDNGMSQASTSNQSAKTATGARTNQTISMNCVSPQAGGNVICRGHWVPTQQTPTVQSEVQSQPAQVVILQTPVTQSHILTPPPVTQTFIPPPMKPPVPCCQQQEVTLIPASFFMGGMSYGVGFPTETSYSYGGGGYAFVGGGTRFSGVRDRVHLDPPPRKPRKPPHKPCGCH